MKKFLSLFISLAMVFGLVGCSSNSDQPAETGAKIAMVTDVGLLKDNGFNEGTYNGVVNFAEANNYTYAYYSPANGSDATDSDREAAFLQAIENGAEIIVAPGYLQATALTAAATANPDVKFVFIDGYILGLDNVTAVSYKEQESGYMAGYAVVKEGYTSLAGVAGGAGTNPACDRFMLGYLLGANDAAAELDTTVDMIISFKNGGSFSASPELVTQVAAYYVEGTQVVFSCGGSMINSVISASLEYPDTKIIGVDVDQASLSDNIITSATKGITASVELILTEWMNGEWDTKLANQESKLGAAENAVCLPTAETSWRFTNFTLDDYNTLFNKIASGEIVVSDEIKDDMSSYEAWKDIDATLTNVTLTIDE